MQKPSHRAGGVAVLLDRGRWLVRCTLFECENLTACVACDLEKPVYGIEGRRSDVGKENSCLLPAFIYTIWLPAAACYSSARSWLWEFSPLASIVLPFTFLHALPKGSVSLQNAVNPHSGWLKICLVCSSFPSGGGNKVQIVKPVFAVVAAVRAVVSPWTRGRHQLLSGLASERFIVQHNH